MKKKILAFVLAIPLFLVAYFFNVQVSSAETLNGESLYVVSDNSFEHSVESDLYYEAKAKADAQAPAGKLLGYVWTKTGDLINVFKDLCNLNEAREANNQTSPLAQISAPYQFLKDGGETIHALYKTLGPGQDILFAAHHPWIFLFTIYFGTSVLLLWFLRLTTGVSPPSIA